MSKLLSWFELIFWSQNYQFQRESTRRYFSLAALCGIISTDFQQLVLFHSDCMRSMTHLSECISISNVCHYCLFYFHSMSFFSVSPSKVCETLSCLWTPCLGLYISLPAFGYSAVINQVSRFHFEFLGLSHLLGFLSHKEFHGIMTFVCTVCDFANNSCLRHLVCL